MDTENFLITIRAEYDAMNNPPKPGDVGPERDAFYCGLAGMQKPKDPKLLGYWNAGEKFRNLSVNADTEGNADWLKKKH